MNISVVGVGYRCPFLTDILAPWLAIKEKHPEYNINICWVSAVFDGFGYQSYDNEDNAKTLRLTEELGFLKFMEIKDKKIKDFESRVAGWDCLKQYPTDWIIQLDGDEQYSSDEILNIFNFIQRNDLTETFRINFKNYFGDIVNQTYVDDFKPLRVINNNSNGGFETFTWDNDGVFKNGKKTQEASCLVIPKVKAFVQHYSWCWWDDESYLRIKRKVGFQNKTLGCCSYKIEDGNLVFNEDYYTRFNIPKPIIYKD